MKKQLSIFLFLSVVLTSFVISSKAGIPIQDKTKATEKKVMKQVQSQKKVAKWKQKLAKKMVARNADIGESKTAAIVFAILIPFVGVAIFQDGITKDFWITLLLTCFLIIPGIIYALSIILKRY
jgi:uncharacterized membrane protein YqaE (UPF0057 family)